VDGQADQVRLLAPHRSVVRRRIASAGLVLIAISSPWLGPAIWADARSGASSHPPTSAPSSLIIGLTAALLVRTTRSRGDGNGTVNTRTWSRVTQDYFDTFSHDMGRPLRRRILGKQREVRARLEEPNHDVPGLRGGPVG
jgi:hypothetical protein